MKLHILVINLDNLKYTKDCLSDLMKQWDMDFELTVIDNASTEIGTEEYFNSIKGCGVNVIVEKTRIPLNWLWNRFYKDNHNEYLCFLNNDTRLSNNYTKTIKQVFELEPSVDIVGHTTNNLQYSKVRDVLEYKILNRKMRQGWDYTIRRNAYVPIPEGMKVYFGDDWLYAQVYKKDRNAAMILNSPIIHFLGLSVKSLKGGEYGEDEIEFKKQGLKNLYSQWSGYSVGKPQFVLKDFFKYEPLITINVVTYERYEKIEVLLKMLQNQTDSRFVVDIWQDGKDDNKREIVESFNDNRFIYNENNIRANTYGHDMRHKSIEKCITPYWCTTNDDNYISPFFVETILKNIKDYDMVKYAVAMENIVWGGVKLEWHQAMSRISLGDHCPETYNPHFKVLDPEVDLIGDVDAASFIVKIDIIKELGGWWSMEFSGDWHVYEKILKSGIKINRINEVLQVHV